MDQRPDEKTLSNIRDACQPQCAAASHQTEKHRFGLIVHGMAQSHFCDMMRTGNSRQKLIAPVSRPTLQAFTSRGSLAGCRKALTDKPKVQPLSEFFNKAFVSIRLFPAQP